MSANLTIYCLSNLTDYLEFERLCHVLMRHEGYRLIEPLGGYNDKGRDAIHVSRQGTVTIFAYSVREDWQAKLYEDAQKIHSHNHACDCLAFLTTASFTATERDHAVKSIKGRYGWTLELYGIERLRILIETTNPDVRKSYPQIFSPHFLRNEGNNASRREKILIFAAKEDGPFAHWLARKLSWSGYQVVCEGLALGDQFNTSRIGKTIDQHTARIIDVISTRSLENPEIEGYRKLTSVFGSSRPGLVTLAWLDTTADPYSGSSDISPAAVHFGSNWAMGLAALLAQFEQDQIPKASHSNQALLAPQTALDYTEEVLYTNCFRASHIPSDILIFDSTIEVPLACLSHWAFKKLTPTRLLAFGYPDESLAGHFGITLVETAGTHEAAARFNIEEKNLKIELIRKSLGLICARRGLKYCPVTKLHYFPKKLLDKDRLHYRRPDGRSTYIKVSGQRSFGPRRELFAYSLAPSFQVLCNANETIAVLTIRIRITDSHGHMYPQFGGNARRKKLCKNWWNPNWFARTLAVSTFLSEDQNHFGVGEGPEALAFESFPIRLHSPVRIDESRTYRSRMEEGRPNDDESDS